MVMKIDAQDVKRGEIILVYPEDIIVEHEDNARKEKHTEADIDRRAEEILQDGQLTPVIVRKVGGHKLKLVAGYCRHAAITKINKTLTPKMRIACIVKELNDEEAFLTSMAENIGRIEPKPIDHAHNHRLLRDRFAWDDERIAKHFRVGLSYVKQLRDLLVLPAVVQKEMKENNLSMPSAHAIKDLPPSVMAEVIAESKNENGTIDNSAVTKNVRAKKIEAGSDKTPPRSLSDLRKFFTSMTLARDISSLGKQMSELMMQFIKGEITDKEMSKEFGRLTDD